MAVVDYSSLGARRPAQVQELEAELAALWGSAAEDTSDRAVTRSCALTLLVYVEGEAAGREALELIDRVTPQNPCRAVVLAAEPNAAPAELRAEVSARCHLPQGGEKEVCCEIVTLLARGEAVHGLDQVAVPLIVPGLPVYLWWRAGRFAPAPWLDGILRSVDRVLVDSAHFSDPETDFAQLAGQMLRFPDVMFTDLNWARLTPWRELIAACFDSPETRPYLDQFDEVRIEYERYSPRVLVHRAQSLLITGWLASRLGWTFIPGPTPPGAPSGASPFLFRAGDREVRIERQPHDFKGGGAGACMAVTLKTTGAAPATFSVARGPDGRTARTCRAVPGQPQMERAVRLEVLDEVELLNGEIRFTARDRVYEEALDAVARLSVSRP